MTYQSFKNKIQLRGDKHFCIKSGGELIFLVGGGGGYDDVDEEMDVFEANLLWVKQELIFLEARRALKF